MIQMLSLFTREEPLIKMLNPTKSNNILKFTTIHMQYLITYTILQEYENLNVALSTATLSVSLSLILNIPALAVQLRMCCHQIRQKINEICTSLS